VFIAWLRSWLETPTRAANWGNLFGEIELAHLLLNNKEEFDRVMDIGEKQRIEAEKKGRDIH